MSEEQAPTPQADEPEENLDQELVATLDKMPLNVDEVKTILVTTMSVISSFKQLEEAVKILDSKYKDRGWNFWHNYSLRTDADDPWDDLQISARRYLVGDESNLHVTDPVPLVSRITITAVRELGRPKDPVKSIYVYATYFEQHPRDMSHLKSQTEA